MISYLEGVLISKRSNQCIVFVNGVGYSVLIAPAFSNKLTVNEPMKLFTYTHVTESSLELFGFASEQDLLLFEQLISVSGVGPKTALSIFNQAQADAIESAICEGDVAFFTAVPRLGKKNAQKLIIELRPKLTNRDDFSLLSDKKNNNQEVVDALTMFGFSKPEITAAIKHIRDKTGKPSEKIRIALKYLGT